MRSILFILTSLWFFVSCNNTTATKYFDDSVLIKEQTNASKVNSHKKLLIEELRKLETVFASNDKDPIVQLFSFPVADSVLDIYIDDSSYKNEFRENGNRTTKDMFIKYFPKIYQYLQVDQLNQLFKQINVDSLIGKDSLQKEVRNQKEPCYQFYHVYVEKNSVTLEFGTNSNIDYVDGSIKTKEDEGSGDECEFISFWFFRFDGQHLHFIRHISAG